MNEAALQRLIDEAELRNLIQTLARALDEKDFDALSALYTEDGSIELGGQIHRGRQALIDAPQRALGGNYEATYHHMGQIYVDVDGDEATTLAYIVAYHIPKTAEPMKHQDGGGKLYADARRTEDGWRFTRVRLDVLFLQGDPLTIDV